MCDEAIIKREQARYSTNNIERYQHPTDYTRPKQTNQKAIEIEILVNETYAEPMIVPIVNILSCEFDIAGKVIS